MTVKDRGGNQQTPPVPSVVKLIEWNPDAGNLSQRPLVKLEIIQDDQVYGVTNDRCDLPTNDDEATITFSSGLMVRAVEQFEGVATHEFGHALGLNHTGREDSIMDGRKPVTMTASECLLQNQLGAELAALRGLTTDDEAALVQRLGEGEPLGGSMHANPSFESGNLTGTWREVNGDFTIRQDVAAKGVYYGRLRGSEPLPSDRQPRISQDVLIWEPGTGDAGAYVRKPDSTAFGTAVVKIRRQVWEWDWDPARVSRPCNTRPIGSWTTPVMERFIPSTEWQHFQTSETAGGDSTCEPPEGEDPGADMHENCTIFLFEIRLTNTLQDCADDDPPPCPGGDTDVLRRGLDVALLRMRSL